MSTVIGALLGKQTFRWAQVDCCNLNFVEFKWAHNDQKTNFSGGDTFSVES